MWALLVGGHGDGPSGHLEGDCILSRSLFCAYIVIGSVVGVVGPNVIPPFCYFCKKNKKSLFFFFWLSDKFSSDF